MKNFFRVSCVCMLILFFPVGCAHLTAPSTSTIAVTGRVPVIDMPVKPVLDSLDPDELAAYSSLPESVRKKLQGNDKKLKMFAAQMQVGIEDYYLYAAVRNKTSEDAVGVKH